MQHVGRDGAKVSSRDKKSTWQTWYHSARMANHNGGIDTNIYKTQKKLYGMKSAEGGGPHKTALAFRTL